RVCSFFFFFFQAEDGIRGGHVTGVQTCALPIWLKRAPIGQIHLLARIGARFSRKPLGQRLGLLVGQIAVQQLQRLWSVGARFTRSEERRVGKECRARWGAYHSRKGSVVRRVRGA